MDSRSNYKAQKITRRISENRVEKDFFNTKTKPQTNEKQGIKD